VDGLIKKRNLVLGKNIQKIIAKDILVMKIFISLKIFQI